VHDAIVAAEPATKVDENARLALVLFHARERKEREFSRPAQRPRREFINPELFRYMLVRPCLIPLVRVNTLA
jgi:hypothetical protein